VTRDNLEAKRKQLEAAAADIISQRQSEMDTVVATEVQAKEILNKVTQI